MNLSVIPFPDDLAVRIPSQVGLGSTAIQLSKPNGFQHYLLRARRVKLLVSVRKVLCRTFRSYLSVCPSVNNAVRCTLLVLNMI